MGTISVQQFSTGDIPTAAQWNLIHNTIVNEINGNLNSDNLADSAVSTVKLADEAVTQSKLGDMEYVALFSYPNAFTASAENLRQLDLPYDCTATKITLRTGHSCSAFAIDLGMADINSSSIGSSFFTAGSASVTASGSTVTVTGASLTNTIISANTKIILTAKTFSDNCGEPLMVNLFVNV